MFITKPPQQLALHGKIADVSIIIGMLPLWGYSPPMLIYNLGDVQDEGTIFSLGSLNITYVCLALGVSRSDPLNNLYRTNAQFASYLAQAWFPGATPADLSKVLKLYPSDPASGSPFGTGSANALTPEYKRIAAVQGDWFFNSRRRQLLGRFSRQQTMYNFREFQCLMVVYFIG